MEKIEKVRNVATWNVRRILYFEPVFEFPLSCHVQILDLPTRFVKLLAKLSSPQQRSTDFLYLPCKLFHNIYTIILEPSPPSLYTFFSRQLYCFLFLLIPTTVTCVYIYIHHYNSSNRETSNAFYRSLSLSFERDSLSPAKQLSILVVWVRVILPIFRSSSSVPLFFLEFFSRRGGGKSSSQRIR